MFFDMAPPPRRPTLFPYTTLFRSREPPGRGRGCHHQPRFGLGQVLLRIDLDLSGAHHDRPGQDRKSTRLNFSHVRTSYAVFCLKKKHPSAVWMARSASATVDDIDS